MVSYRGSICAWIIFATYSSAETFFVAQEEENASDNNPGTEEKPFRTLTRADEVAKPSDKVWVKAGVYHETLAPESEDVTFREDIIPPCLPRTAQQRR